jgi:hypothetical protein
MLEEGKTYPQFFWLLMILKMVNAGNNENLEKQTNLLYVIVTGPCLHVFTNPESTDPERSTVLCHHFSLPKLIIKVQNGNGVLNRLVPCI